MMTIQHCWWQIIVATIVYFALGALWFNPKVLGTMWANSHGIVMSEESKAKAPVGRIMGLGFVCTLVLCAIICWVCCASNTYCMVDGTCVSGGMMGCIKGGVAVGIATAAAISIGYLYQMKPMNAYLTDCGYHFVGCVLAAITMHLLGCC